MSDEVAERGWKRPFDEPIPCSAAARSTRSQTVRLITCCQPKIGAVFVFAGLRSHGRLNWFQSIILDTS
jgi:hypothetical protein